MELHHKMVSLERFEYCIQEFLHLFASLYGVKETIALAFLLYFLTFYKVGLKLCSF